MGIYLNPGNKNFQEHIERRIYVDKSGLIRYTNELIYYKDKFVCVSRPRRFGKSHVADMLTAYYGRGCDSHAQFDGLEIVKDDTYELHINKYNVIHVDVSGYLKSYSHNATVIDILDRLISKITSELKKEYPDVIRSKDDNFPDYLAEIYDATKIQFVFIVDEWDAIFRNRKDDLAGQREYLDWLEALLKGRVYVALAYMTGILPIKKYATGSA
ncbi:MAG: AAA family ATPase, partial [Clostridia bacterium]|nr:AAA family ATPase [Clostridia bacterium]